LVRDLRVFSRRDEVEQASIFEIKDAVEQALRLTRRDLVTAAIVERDYDDDLPQLRLPGMRLIQVLGPGRTRALGVWRSQDGLNGCTSAWPGVVV
jgi:nitrogen-specific signal transduction histidine kinase